LFDLSDSDITDDEDDVTVIAEEYPVSDTDDSEDDVTLENESSGEVSDGEPTHILIVNKHFSAGMEKCGREPLQLLEDKENTMLSDNERVRFNL
jgi:hypothetical protein